MPLRIAHFTDLHFTEDPRLVPLRSLLSKRLLGWVNLRYRGRYRAFSRPRRVVRALLADLREVVPDQIVFTGDATGMALESEFLAARRSLEPLLEDDRVLAIPGNHDLYLRSVAREDRFGRHFASWERSDLSDLPPTPSGGKGRYPLVRLLGEEAAIFALRDARPAWPHDSSGRVPREQLRALERLVGRLELAGRILILALHYCPILPDGRRDTYLHRLRNDREVLSLARRLGFRVVLCGHVHHRLVLPLEGDPPMTVANPGSLTYLGRRHAYHLLSVEDGRIGLEARRFDPDSGRFTAWPEAPGTGLLWGSPSP